VKHFSGMINESVCKLLDESRLMFSLEAVLFVELLICQFLAQGAIAALGLFDICLVLLRVFLVAWGRNKEQQQNMREHRAT